MISHISVKNLPPKKKHSATPQNGISCVTPPTTWWWCLIKNTLYFGKPITKTFLFPSWWSWEGGVPLISPPPQQVPCWLSSPVRAQTGSVMLICRVYHWVRVIHVPWFVAFEKKMDYKDWSFTKIKTTDWIYWIMTQPGMMDDLDLLGGHPVEAQFAVSLLMLLRCWIDF